MAAGLVAFATLFRDIVERTIRPTALVRQELAEAWIIHRKIANQMERMRDAQAVLRGLREFLRVLVILMQWVSSATCVNLLEAAHYASPGDRMIFGKYEEWGPRRHTVWGRVCPRFMHAMAGFISRETPMYRGTPLQRTRGRGPAGVQVPAGRPPGGPPAPCPRGSLRSQTHAQEARRVSGAPKTERGDSLTEGVLKVGAGVGAALQMLVPGGMQGRKAVVVSAPSPPAAVGGFVAVSYGAPALRS